MSDEQKTESLDETIAKGIAVTRQAIQDRKVDLFKRCIGKLKRINAPIEKIWEVIGECPMDLMQEAGIKVTMDTSMGQVILGETFSWEEIAAMLQSDPRPDSQSIANLLQEKRGSQSATLTDEPPTGDLFD